MAITFKSEITEMKCNLQLSASVTIHMFNSLMWLVATVLDNVDHRTSPPLREGSSTGQHFSRGLLLKTTKQIQDLARKSLRGAEWLSDIRMMSKSKSFSILESARRSIKLHGMGLVCGCTRI